MKAQAKKAPNGARHLAMVACVLLGVFVYAGWRIKSRQEQQAVNNQSVQVTTEVINHVEDFDIPPIASEAPTLQGNALEGFTESFPPISSDNNENSLPSLAPSDDILDELSSDLSIPEPADEEILLADAGSFTTPDRFSTRTSTPTRAEAPSLPAAEDVPQFEEEIVEDISIPALTESITERSPSTRDSEITYSRISIENDSEPEEFNISSTTYTVKSGDTLSKIALRKCGSKNKAREIFALNRDLLQSPDRLIVGMKLKLPFNQEVSSPLIHKVLESDSLPSLAIKYYGEVTPSNIRGIREANPALKRGGFKPGLKLVIPQANINRAPASSNHPLVESIVHTPAGNEIYAVKRGDTLSRIAAKVYGNGSKWRNIYNANRNVLASPEKLEVGMKLQIP